MKPKELTLRGLILGVLLTLVFTAANVYLGLKVGLTFASSIPAGVTTASSPAEAWAATVDAIKPSGHLVPPKLCTWDASTEVEQVAEQLTRVFEEAPLPADLTFLYFGLVDLWIPERNAEEAGFHVAGGSGTDPEAELAEPRLPYYPEDAYLESTLLQEIRLASKALGPDYNVFDYGLMLGAAGTLAKFAVRRLQLSHAIMVGFDCGDSARFA
jgi:OPT oligopeptide transporter protein